MKLLAFLILPFFVAAQVDTSKLQWSVLSAKLKGPQSDMTATLNPDDGKIYIAGGCVSPTGSIYNEKSQILQCNQDTDLLYSFDPATNTFQNLPRLPRNRFRHAAAIANGKLFLIGGRTAIDDILIPEIDVSYTLFLIIRCVC
jgi:Kelch motif